MAKTKTLYANNARTTLGADITTSSVSFTVGDASSFPTIVSSGDQFYVTLYDKVNIEIVLVTAVSSNTFTVTRAQDGTTAHAFLAATPTVVSLRLVSASIRNFARLDDRMGVLSGIAALTSPSTSNGNSYVLGDTAADASFVTAIANTSTNLWTFTGYPAVVYTGTIGAGASTTVINLATATTVLPDQSSNAYIFQMTSGSMQGQARYISAMSSSTFNLSSALGSTPGSGDTYSVHRHVGANTSTYSAQLAQGMDPTFITSFVTAKNGDKRITSGAIQQYDGTTWNNYPLNYVAQTTATIGSYSVAGANGGYAGFMFPGAFHVQSMLASTTAKQSGVYSNTDSTWDWRWDAGILAVGTVPYANVSGTPNLTVYAPLASPIFTGTPVGPTASNGTNTTQLATTAFVHNAVVFTGNATAGTKTYTQTGVIEQWFESFQSAAGGGIVTITYPVAFTGTAGKPRVTLLDANLGSLGASNFVVAQPVTSSLTGCTVNIGQNGGGTRDITLLIEVRGT